MINEKICLEIENGKYEINYYMRMENEPNSISALIDGKFGWFKNKRFETLAEAFSAHPDAEIMIGKP